jgi:hypothetical protein
MGSLLRSSYLCYFSKPAHERALYKAVQSRPIRSIVELGIGFGGRTERILEVAAWRADCLPLRYTGIDLFEARPAAERGPSLKQAFSRFHLPNVKTQLVPGDPQMALRRVANALVGTDLLLIAANHDPESLGAAWTWMPRMLTANSLVFLEERPPGAGQARWRQMPLDEIHKLAAAANRPARQAA